MRQTQYTLTPQHVHAHATYLIQKHVRLRDHGPKCRAWMLWTLRDRLAPGLLFALYLVLSGLERFLVEFVRRNHEVWAGLTAPQLESLALMVIGLTWIAVATRRRAVFRRLKADHAPVPPGSAT